MTLDGGGVNVIMWNRRDAGLTHLRHATPADDQTHSVTCAMMMEHSAAIADKGMRPEERALVIELVRYLDRVAFIPRDLVIAHASGRLAAAAFDRYRVTCEQANGAVRDAVWTAVIDTLGTRALALAVRV